MSKKNQDEIALIEQIKMGDQTAFKRLFDRFYKIMLAIAINILKDIELSKDVVQEVFFQIWKKRESLTIHSTLEGYLKRATVNRCLNVIKARKRFDSPDALEQKQSSAPSAQEGLEATDLQKVIQSAMDALPEKCRVVFIMRRHEGMPVKEIAEKLGISPKTVENQITKALKILKETVKTFREQNG